MQYLQAYSVVLTTDVNITPELIDMDLREIVRDILKVLKEVDEKEWVPVFANFSTDTEIMNPKDIKRSIRRIYGAMDSFNDLVLYNAGKVCYEENVRLDELRKRLFKEITT